jgi:hypothetical protein
MGTCLDSWLEQDDNLDMWTRGLTASGKRVLMTKIIGEAWANMCARLNFENAAKRTGCLMTIDSTGDDLIQPQGLSQPYTFSAKDAGDNDRDSSYDEHDSDSDLSLASQSDAGDSDDSEGELCPRILKGITIVEGSISQYSLPDTKTACCIIAVAVAMCILLQPTLLHGCKAQELANVIDSSIQLQRFLHGFEANMFLIVQVFSRCIKFLSTHPSFVSKRPSTTTQVSSH